MVDAQAERGAGGQPEPESRTRTRPGRTAALLAIAWTMGCTRTLYAPAICAVEHVDTVLTVVVGQTPVQILETRCLVWQAWDDSTKRWDTAGRRLP